MMIVHGHHEVSIKVKCMNLPTHTYSLDKKNLSAAEREVAVSYIVEEV